MSTDPLPIEISCQDVAAMRSRGDEFLLVDCREPDEAAICRIEGAELLPMSTIADQLGAIADRAAGRIVVHCHKGGRSLRVAQWLRDQGYHGAQSMAGGIEQWAADIEPGMPTY
ncbi:MAG TPA: rhodanese-like domain-containing protein [Lacipirellulaceae bacterium]|nr:rhodanese-like domain-containing protein [Lacipirellulaceae bacterium]